MSLGVGAYKVGGAGQCSTNSKQLQQHFVKNRKQARGAPGRGIRPPQL